MHRFAHQCRGAFEHFGHDACLFPISTYPFWTRRFRQFREKLDQSQWFKRLPDAKAREQLREQIALNGPLCSADFTHEAPKAPRKMWERPPTKLALDYMWYCGELTTAYRQGFQKYYDLTDRVIPRQLREAEQTDAAQIDWLCRNALQRLGFASAGELKRFWDACTSAEVRQWISENDSDWVPVQVEGADSSVRQAIAPADIEVRLNNLSKPTSRLRVLNPFDPAVRDRKRLSFLFGFDYVNEIFVPKAKRRWGYYVYPVLEDDRIIARIDLSGGPKTGIRPIQQQWIEPRVRWSAHRQNKLEAEVARLSRLSA